MHGYSRFDADVRIAFQAQIEKYGLVLMSHFEVEESSDVYLVQLSNDVFIIEFSLDRMELLVEVVDPRNQESFAFIDVIDHLSASDNSIVTDGPFRRQTRDFIKSQLKSCSELFNTYLHNVVLGDFSWSANLKISEEQKKMMFSRVMSLGYNHPLYQETMAGNENWYDKAREHFCD